MSKAGQPSTYTYLCKKKQDGDLSTETGFNRLTDFSGRESTARFDLVVRVDDVPGLGMRSLNFAKTEAMEDASALPPTSGIDTPLNSITLCLQVCR